MSIEATNLMAKFAVGKKLLTLSRKTVGDF